MLFHHDDIGSKLEIAMAKVPSFGGEGDASNQEEIE
jgi:hypothetical protein